MARVRQRASETASKRRSPTKERQQKAALRELVGPMGLLRAVRRFASLQGREVDVSEWSLVRNDVLLRCAAIDPSLQAMSGEEVAEQLDRPDQDSQDRESAQGVKQVAMSSLSEDDQLMASRVGEIRAATHRLSSSSLLSPDAADHLRRLADALQSLIADPSLPLSPQEQRIWDMLMSRPEDKPLTQAKIVAGLSVKGGAVSAENARKSLSGILRRKGVLNRRRAGYYIPAEFRPEQSTDK